MSKSALRTRSLLLTALFAALTAVGAFLRVPVGPISFTLQVFFTCTAGLLLGLGTARPRRPCTSCWG